jgi:hypothetical protein
MLAHPGGLSAEIYDLADDWSTASNPFGPWSVRDGDDAMVAETDLSTTGIDDWSSPQPGYSGQGDFVPVAFKANGSIVIAHDWQPGDIVVHTSRDISLANLVWTSPDDGVIDVVGDVWIGRDIGRGNDWRLLLNDVLITSGRVFSGDAWDRANPMPFAMGSAGAGVLQDIPVAAGDELKLEFERTGSTDEDYVGINFSVDFIPEPASLVAIGVGAVALLRRRRGA